MARSLTHPTPPLSPAYTCHMTSDSQAHTCWMIPSVIYVGCELWSKRALLVRMSERQLIGRLQAVHGRFYQNVPRLGHARLALSYVRLN